MNNDTFTLQIGSLLFGTKSISYITFSLFILGIIVGSMSAIYIDNQNISFTILLPFIVPMVISIIIMIKGIRMAKAIE